MRRSLVFFAGILCLVPDCGSTEDIARQTFRVSVPSRPHFSVLPEESGLTAPLSIPPDVTHRENIRVSSNSYQGVTLQFSTDGLPEHHLDVSLSLDVVNETRQDAWMSVRSTDVTQSQNETDGDQACVSILSTHPGIASVGLTLTLVGSPDKFISAQDATVTIIGTICQD